MIRPMHMISGFLMAVVVAVVAVTVTADSPTTVQIRDDCDPATFNAFGNANGLGDICQGDGQTTFGDFIAELQATHVAEKWRFNPDRMSEPRRIVAHNRGGETHTFTKVENFGGGVNTTLNALSNNPIQAPECLSAKFAATQVAPGDNLDPGPVSGGDKFQCCIHPWMRTTVRQR